MELYFLTIEVTNTIYLTVQETSVSELDPDLSAIPLKYDAFVDLFSKKKADKLPTHRTYDHEILLEPGKALSFSPIYKLSLIELEVMQKYITENLRKGFICHSQSLYRARIVFAKKVDGIL